MVSTSQKQKNNQLYLNMPSTTRSGLRTPHASGRSFLRPSSTAGSNTPFTVGATATACFYPIAGAMVTAEQELGENRTWEGINPQQVDFLKKWFNTGTRADLKALSDVMKGKCSRDYKVLNQFLKDEGFSIELQPFRDPDDFGAASVLKLAMEWETAGTAETLTLDGDESGKYFDAVRMKKNVPEFRNAPGHNHPVVSLATKGGRDTVHLTMVDNPLTDGQVMDKAIELLGRMHFSDDEFDGVIFPMVDLDVQPDISWLLGINTDGTDGRPAIVNQAKQQTKFAIDEFGAKVESAVVIGVTRSIARRTEPHVINRPFLAMVTREGVKNLIFAGYISPAHWKRPAKTVG